VMLREDGSAAFIDFGLSRQLGLESDITATGVIFGTPHYMSPEQGHGKPLDERSDLYSLGIILYELLTAEKPYVAETAMGVIYCHGNSPIPRLPAALAHLQPLLDGLLAKDPSKRPSSAGDIVALIDELLECAVALSARSGAAARGHPSFCGREIRHVPWPRHGSERNTGRAPFQHAALRMPVAEHDATRGVAIDLEVMDRGPVRVAMNQATYARPAKRVPHGGGIHVHDFRQCRGCVHAAAGAEATGQRLAPLQAHAPEHPSHGGIAHDAAQPLVVAVVGAEHVAVHQQHPLAVKLDDGAVVDQRAARVAAEALAEHEIAIAVHDEAGHTGLRERTQRGRDVALGRVRVVVADPDLEEVAQDVQGLRLARLVLQEGEKLGRDGGPGGIEMQVRDE